MIKNDGKAYGREIMDYIIREDHSEICVISNTTYLKWCDTTEGVFLTLNYITSNVFQYVVDVITPDMYEMLEYETKEDWSYGVLMRIIDEVQDAYMYELESLQDKMRRLR